MGRIRNGYEEFREDGSTKKKVLCSYSLPKRYILAIIALLGYASTYAVRVHLSVAIVAMTTNKTVWLNATSSIVEPADFDWDLTMQGHILGSSYWGYLLSQIPSGVLAKRFGGKTVFGSGVLFSSVLSLFIPLTASINVYLFITLRFLQGLSEGLTIVAALHIWSKWAPTQEKTKLVTSTITGAFWGSAFSLEVSGLLAGSSLGWPLIFYVIGIAAVICSVAWFVIVAETPETHKTISQEELLYILENRPKVGTEKKLDVPWFKIFKSASFLSLVAAHFSVDWGLFTWLTELPTYFGNALHFNLFLTGHISAVSQIVLFAVGISSSILADNLINQRKWSTTFVRKLYICGASSTQTVLMILAGSLMVPTVSAVLLVIYIGITGFLWASVAVNFIDLAPQYASIMMGMSNTISTLPGIISPSLTGILVVDGKPSQWSSIFFIAAGIHAFCGTMYVIFGSGQRMKWTEVSDELTMEDMGKDKTTVH